MSAVDEASTTLLCLNRSVWLVSMSWVPTLQISFKVLLQQWNAVSPNDSWTPLWASIPGQPRSAPLLPHCFIEIAAIRWLLRHKMATCCFWHLLIFPPATLLIHCHLLYVLFWDTVLRAQFWDITMLSPSKNSVVWGQCWTSRFKWVSCFASELFIDNI